MLLLETRIRAIRVFRTAFAMPLAFSVGERVRRLRRHLQPGDRRGQRRARDSFGIDRDRLAHRPVVALLASAHHDGLDEFGYNVLVLSAGVGGDPCRDHRGGDRLDGADGWRLARSITVPLLGPQLFFLVVVSTIQSLQSFGQIQILTPEAGRTQSTKTLVYSIYEQAFAFGSSDFGLASAQAIVLLLIVLACTAVQFGVLETAGALP